MKNILLVIIYTILSSCSLFHKQELNSYYKKVKGEVETEINLDNAKKVVEITHFYVQPSQISPLKEEFKNSLSLLDRGQEKYIEVLGNEFKGKPQEFIKNIAAPFKTSVAPKNESIVDKNEFHIKLNLNIIDKRNNVIQANRISDLKVNFIMKNPDVNFFKFDNIQTKYEVLDFGKLTNTNAQNISLNAGANIEFGATANLFNDAGGITNTSTNSNTPTLGAGFGASNSRTQEVLLSKRVLSQNAALTNRYAYISLEGTPANNLEGPLNIEFTIKSDSIKERVLTKYEKLFDKEKPVNQDLVRSYTLVYQIPDIKDDIKILMTYEYNYREVIKNHNTVSEADDHIIYKSGRPEEETELVGLWKKDLKLLAYYLWDEKTKMYVGKDGIEAAFATLEEADSFRKWLIASKSSKVQNKILTLIDHRTGNSTPLPLIENLDLIILPINLFELITTDKN